jgi:hypothetical protein
LTRIANALQPDLAPPGENLRDRSNSTHIPATEARFYRQSSREARVNVFDREPYKSAAQASHRFETALGKALIDSPTLRNIAKEIRRITGAPQTMRDFPPADREKINKESSFIGGAKELLQDIDNLDAHVMAALIKAERAEYSYAHPENDTAAGVDHLDFQVSDRRKCLFNFVADYRNVIYPWNSHRFDLEVHAVNDATHYPERIKNIIADRWNALIVRQPDPDAYVHVTLGLPHHHAKSGIMDILQSLDEPARRTLLHENLHVAWSTETSIDDEQNHRGSNPLGEEFRQHKTGARSNVVRFSDERDRNVNQWVLGAIVHGKPVVSGPSGHTLRYLNHYAMCIRMLALSGTDVRDFPSLADARLVMLGNLLTPKNHHSYHEIMLASVGVDNGLGEVLHYDHHADYTDLESSQLGREVLLQARAFVKTI